MRLLVCRMQRNDGRNQSKLQEEQAINHPRD
jgi:hypothetical protein